MKKHPFLTGFLLVFLIGIISIACALLCFSKKHLFSTALPGRGKIAIVEVEGIITQSHNIIKTLDSYKDNANIKAIIVRIDTPGGGVGPSQEIYEELFKLRDRKYLVVSMGSVAASGGYYIACAAHTIYANPGTITGSIGVIIEVANIEELLGKIGLKTVVIKSGKYKDMLSPTREIGKDEKALVQGVIDSIHNQFINAVARGRNLSRDKIEPIADGRIFSGEQAQALGLIDKLGNLQDAVHDAAEKTGLDADADVIYPDKKRLSLLEYVIDESAAKITDILMRSRLTSQFILSN